MVRLFSLHNIGILFPQLETRWCRVSAYVFRGGRVCTPFKSSRPSSREVEIVRPGASWTGRGAFRPGEERTRYTEIALLAQPTLPRACACLCCIVLLVMLASFASSCSHCDYACFFSCWHVECCVVLSALLALFSCSRRTAARFCPLLDPQEHISPLENSQEENDS